MAMKGEMLWRRKLLRHPSDGGHPSSEDGPKANGLHDFLNPGQADSVIGMEEVDAEEKPRELMAMAEFSCREDGDRAVKKGPSSD